MDEALVARERAPRFAEWLTKVKPRWLTDPCPRGAIVNESLPISLAGRPHARKGFAGSSHGRPEEPQGRQPPRHAGVRPLRAAHARDRGRGPPGAFRRPQRRPRSRLRRGGG